MNGVTDSERYLNELCNHTFLKLWSFPNPYRDQGAHSGSIPGKELCDLLVVFGEHILIFSDKDIRFQSNINVDLAWKRWAKKSIIASAKQIYGAERWIKEHKDRVFLDQECTISFPLELPDLDKAIFHRIIVTHNSAQEFRKYVKGRGTLIIRNDLIDDQILTEPFHVGIGNRKRGYVHTLDDVSLDILMRELDTVSDFINYLAKKERFLSNSEITVYAAGEEELLGYYLRTLDENEEHDFVVEPGYDAITLDEGIWASIEKLPQFRGSKERNKISYLWDKIIESVGSHIVNGTLEYSNGGTLDEKVLALKFMASEDRLSRRMLSQAIIGIIDKTPDGRRGARVVKSGDSNNIGYVFLICPPEENPDKYSEYREYRRALLAAYCHAFKAKELTLENIVGFATEKPGNRGHSEDIIYLDASNWTDEDYENAQQLREETGILKNPEEIHGRDWEFPLSEHEDSEINRTKESKRREDKLRKRKRQHSRRDRRKNRSMRRWPSGRSRNWGYRLNSTSATQPGVWTAMPVTRLYPTIRRAASLIPAQTVSWNM